MKVLEFDDVEKEILKGIPKKVLICILLPILSTFLLSYFDIADWAIESQMAISASLVILGYIIPTIYITKYLFGK